MVTPGSESSLEEVAGLAEWMELGRFVLWGKGPYVFALFLTSTMFEECDGTVACRGSVGSESADEYPR